MPWAFLSPPRLIFQTEKRKGGREREEREEGAIWGKKAAASLLVESNLIALIREARMLNKRIFASPPIDTCGRWDNRVRTCGN